MYLGEFVSNEKLIFSNPTNNNTFDNFSFIDVPLSYLSTINQSKNFIIASKKNHSIRKNFSSLIIFT